MYHAPLDSWFGVSGAENMYFMCRWSAPGLTKPTFEEAMQQKFRSAKKVGDALDFEELILILIQGRFVWTILCVYFSVFLVLDC